FACIKPNQPLARSMMRTLNSLQTLYITAWPIFLPNPQNAILMRPRHRLILEPRHRTAILYQHTPSPRHHTYLTLDLHLSLNQLNRTARTNHPRLYRAFIEIHFAENVKTDTPQTHIIPWEELLDLSS